MTDIIRLIVKIILIILLPLMLLIYIVEMNKLGVFENIKNLFSNDDNTNEVVVDPDVVNPDVVNPDDVKIIDDDTHLIFNNVPINGSLKNYVAQMEKKNFRIYVKRDMFDLEGDEETKEQKEKREQKAKLEAYKEGKAMMVGDFADFKKCSLYVETLANKDLVYKIQVQFQYVSEWEKKKENYFHLKQLLTKKYGAPTSCTEKLKPETMENYDINNSFTKGKSKYETIYKTDKGDITLYINKHYYLILEYLDKKNSELITEHALEEL